MKSSILKQDNWLLFLKHMTDLQYEIQDNERKDTEYVLTQLLMCCNKLLSDYNYKCAFNIYLDKYGYLFKRM
jgi:hypothetical protein